MPFYAIYNVNFFGWISLWNFHWFFFSHRHFFCIMYYLYVRFLLSKLNKEKLMFYEKSFFWLEIHLSLYCGESFVCESCLLLKEIGKSANKTKISTVWCLIWLGFMLFYAIFEYQKSDSSKHFYGFLSWKLRGAFLKKVLALVKGENKKRTLAMCFI